jgi:hypothetical protein
MKPVRDTEGECGRKKENKRNNNKGGKKGMK